MAENIGNVSLGLGIDLTILQRDMQKAEQMLNDLKGKVSMGTGKKADDFLGTNEVAKRVKELDKAFRSIQWDIDPNAKNKAMELAQSFVAIKNNSKEAHTSLEQYVNELKRLEEAKSKQMQGRFQESISGLTAPNKELQKVNQYYAELEKADEKRIDNIQKNKLKEEQIAEKTSQKIIDQNIKERQRIQKDREAYVKWWEQQLKRQEALESKKLLSPEKAMGLSTNTIAERQNKINQLTKTIQNLDSRESNYTQTLTRLNREKQKLTRENQKYMTQGVEVEKSMLRLGHTASYLSRRIAILASVTTLQRFIDKVVEVRGEFELQQRSLAAIIQNKQEADKIFQQTVSLALESPFRLKELITYTRELSAYRVETEKLFGTTKMLADVSAGLGVDMSRLILAYGQVRSAAVLRGQELRQFTEAGIPIIAELAKKFSELEGRVVQTSEVFEKVSRREVPFAMVSEIFEDMTRKGGIFYNMQKIQAETIKGKWSNLKDAYDLMYNSIGKGNETVIKDTIDLTKEMLKNYQLVIDNVKVLIGLFALYKVGMFAKVAATKTFASATIQGAGALKMFKGMLVEDAVALNKATAATMGLSRAKMALGKGAIYASFGLKAAGQAMWAFTKAALPLLVLGAAIEGVLLLINRFRNIKKVQEATDEFTASTILSGEAINKNIDKLRELGKEYASLDEQIKSGTMSADARADAEKRLQEINKERAPLIAEIAKTEGQMADKLDDSKNSQKEINKIQDEYNGMLRTTILLRQLLANESSSPTQTLVEDYDAYSTAENKRLAKLEEVRAMYATIRFNIEEGIKSGKFEESANKSLLNILESGQSLERQLKQIFLFTNVRGDLKKSIWGSYNMYSVTDLEKLTVDAKKLLTPMEQGMKNVADQWVATLKVAGYDVKNMTQEMANNIRDILTKTTGREEMANMIASFMPLAEYVPVVKSQTGWRKTMVEAFKGDMKDINAIIESQEMTLTSALKAIYDNKANLEKEYANLSNMTEQQRIDANEQANYEGMKTRIAAMDSYLKMYNYSEEKATKSTKDAIVEKWKKEVQGIEKAKSAYEDYLKVMGKEQALAKVRERFGNVDADLLSNPASMIAYLSELQMKALKRTSEEAKGFVIELADNLAKLEVNIDTKSLREAKEKMDRVFENYEMTLQIKSIAGGSFADIFTGTTSLSELERTVNAEIRKLRAIGGEDALKQADELEKKLFKVVFDRRKDLYSEIKKLEEDLRGTPEKIEANAKELVDLELQWAVLVGKGKLSLEEQLQVRLLELRMATIRKEQGLLETEAFKTTKLYEKLFGDMADLSVNSIKAIIDESIKVRDAVTLNKETGVYEGKVTVGGQEQTIKLTAQEYMALLKKIPQLQRDVDKSNPFARIKKDIEAIGDETDTTLSKQEKWLRLANDVNDAVKDFSEMGRDAISMAEMLGLSEETSQQLNGVIDLLGGAAETGLGVAQLMNGEIVQGLKNVIKGLGNMVKGIINIGDAKYNRIIRNHQERIDSLKESYDNLADAAEKAFNLQGMAKGIKDMTDNLNRQIASLSAMRRAEQDKKATDKKKVSDYTNEIKDLQEQQKKLWEDFYEELRGTNIKTAADDFASAWVNAFLEGENAMDSFRDRFDEMIKQMVIKQASLRIVGDLLKPLFDQIDVAFGDDGILDTDEMKAISDMLPNLMSNIDTALQGVIQPLLESAGMGKGYSALNKSGLQKGIQAIQEDTAQQLVALLNTMRYEIIRQGVSIDDMKQSLVGIHNVVSDSLHYTKEIFGLLVEMRSWQRSITHSGHPNGGYGLKMFSN